MGVGFDYCMFWGCDRLPFVRSVAKIDWGAIAGKVRILVKLQQTNMSTLTDIGTLIVSTPGICGGHPRIAGHRVSVQNIAIDYNAGMSPEEIAKERTQLTLAQIYAALAYYHANKDEMDAAIAVEEVEWERLEAESTNGKQA
jgi:uncharacterized protein (DUF433 family)